MPSKGRNKTLGLIREEIEGKTAPSDQSLLVAFVGPDMGRIAHRRIPPRMGAPRKFLPWARLWRVKDF